MVTKRKFFDDEAAASDSDNESENSYDTLNDYDMNDSFMQNDNSIEYEDDSDNSISDDEILDDDEFSTDAVPAVAVNSIAVTKSIESSAKRARGRPKKIKLSPAVPVCSHSDSLPSAVESVIFPPLSSDVEPVVATDLSASNKKTCKKKITKPQLKPFGDACYDINGYSLTVAKINGDVPLNYIDITGKFIEDNCIRGMASGEVGARAHNLHVQAVFEARYSTSEKHMKQLKSIIKALYPVTKGYKIMVVKFRGSQNFSNMIGYCTKDKDKPHFRSVCHNVDISTLVEGQLNHAALKTSFDDNKFVLTLKNMMQMCFRFNMRCLSPIIVPFHFALLYMIQSGEYIFSPDLIASYKKLHLDEASALWKMIHFPTHTTMEMVQSLVFDSRSYGPDSRCRFFDDKFYNPPSRYSNLSKSGNSSSDFVSNHINRANEIIAMCRAKPRPSNNPQQLNHLEPLPVLDEDKFDNISDDGIVNKQICPATWAEMVSIVAETRRRFEFKQTTNLSTPSNFSNNVYATKGGLHMSNLQLTNNPTTGSDLSSKNRHMNLSDVRFCDELSVHSAATSTSAYSGCTDKVTPPRTRKSTGSQDSDDDH